MSEPGPLAVLLAVEQLRRRVPGGIGTYARGLLAGLDACAAEGDPMVLSGQGPAPSNASAAAYRELGLDLVPGSGALAAAVPGAVDAWLVLLRDKGTWGLEGVLEHAIALAERGHFPIPQIGRTVESVRGLFTDHWTTSAEVYLPQGKAPSPDERLVNPALAATWKRWLSESEAGGGDRETRIERARQVWRQGFIAEAFVRAANTPTFDATGSEHGALCSRWESSARSSCCWPCHSSSPTSSRKRSRTPARRWWSGCWKATFSRPAFSRAA